MMDIYIPPGPFLFWVSDVLLRLWNMRIRSVMYLLLDRKKFLKCTKTAAEEVMIKVFQGL